MREAATVSGPYAVRLLRSQSIPADSEVRLAADVFLPCGAPPGPALVALVPYHKDGTAGVSHWVPNHAFAAHGYASVLVDLQGHGGSTGRRRPPLADEEANDGLAAVAWAAAQPWCDGRIGLWGASYGAVTALRTAAHRPAGLGAVVAVIGQADGDRHVFHPGGARGWFTGLGQWALAGLTRDLLPPLHHDAGGRWLELWRERLARDDEPQLLDLVRHGPGDPAWRGRAVGVEEIAAPTFCIGGWRDLMCEGTIDVYERLRVPRKLLMGPWMHTRPDNAADEPLDFAGLALRWFDRWLREAPNGIDVEPAATLRVQGVGGWRDLPGWPGGGRPLELCLSADGTLVCGEAALAGEPGGRIDPTVGAASGLWWFTSAGIGLPRDQHDDDARSIGFTGAPVSTALTIVGRPSAELVVCLDGSDPRSVVAKLCDVDADGRSTLICAGTTRADGDGLVKIALAPTAYRLAAGHRLRLTVAGADFPRLWPDPSPGRLSVRCGGDTPSRVTVPVTDGLPGAPATPPGAPPAAPHPLVMSASPTYSVSRDHVALASTVRVGDAGTIRLPGGEATLTHAHEVEATVAADRPALARLGASARAVLNGPAGEVVVATRLVVVGHGLAASAEVTWDGVTITTPHWIA